MSIEKLGQHFVAIEDPRCSGRIEHRLVEVLVIAVCAVIACAESWAGSLAAGFEREVVALDGKTIRRSFDHGRERSALHVVSAWASEQGLVLGHSRKLAETAARFAADFAFRRRCVDGKSNEITAIPELLDQLVLENSIVTLDAMGCQTPPQTQPQTQAFRRLRVSARSPRRSWRAGATAC